LKNLRRSIPRASRSSIGATSRPGSAIPQAKGDLQFTWPATTIDSQARLDEEAAFFDDMLSCVSAQYHVDSNCVASTGVSAGALWTSQLVGVRGEWISSFMSLSGGTGGLAIKPWKEPTHKMPGFVLRR
jgi:poly(3-hydroxybutyrate) depolymerase